MVTKPQDKPSCLSDTIVAVGLTGTAGPVGPPGTGVSSASLVGDELFFQLTNGTVLNAGWLPPFNLTQPFNLSSSAVVGVYSSFTPLTTVQQVNPVDLTKGSGFLIRPNLLGARPYVVTAAENVVQFGLLPPYPVATAIYVRVELNRPRLLPVDLVAYDGSGNLALLAFSPLVSTSLLAGLADLQWANSQQSLPGSDCAIIGYPNLGTSRSLMDGNVRNPRYGLTGLVESVLTSVPLASSQYVGGPLVNKSGQVLGMVSQPLAPGLSLATAQVIAQPVLEEMMAWHLAGQPANPRFDGPVYQKLYLGFELTKTPISYALNNSLADLAGAYLAQLAGLLWPYEDFLVFNLFLDPGFALGPNSLLQTTTVQGYPTILLEQDSYLLTSLEIGFGTIGFFFADWYNNPVRPGSYIELVVYGPDPQDPSLPGPLVYSQVIPITEAIKAQFTMVGFQEYRWLANFVLDQAVPLSPDWPNFFVGVNYSGLYDVDWPSTIDDFIFGITSSFEVVTNPLGYVRDNGSWLPVNQTSAGDAAIHILPNYTTPEERVGDIILAIDNQPVGYQPDEVVPSTVSIYQLGSQPTAIVRYRDASDGFQVKEQVLPRVPLPLTEDRPSAPVSVAPVNQTTDRATAKALMIKQAAEAQLTVHY